MVSQSFLILAVFCGFLVGLFIGLVAWYQARSTSQTEGEALRVRIAGLEKERETEGEKLRWTEQAESKMRDAFSALAGEALRLNSEALSRQTRGDLKTVVEPLKENLASLDGHVRELEIARKGAYQSIQQQLTHLGETHARLQHTTTTLTQALKSPTVRVTLTNDSANAYKVYWKRGEFHEEVISQKRQFTPLVSLFKK